MNTEAASSGILYKKLFLRILQYSQENTCVGIFFLMKLQDLFRRTPANFCFWKYTSGEIFSKDLSCDVLSSLKLVKSTLFNIENR